MTTERNLNLLGAHGPIPTVVWQPTEAGAANQANEAYPLVLAGHGGGSHKTDGFVTALRDRLLQRSIAVAAIDAVGHGERAPDKQTPESVIRVISEAASYRQMTADWTAALDALLETGDFAAGAVAYAGLSGGTLFGLPFIASDERITAAVLGACGYEGAPLLGDAPSTFAPVLHEAAQDYHRPALFLLQADDDYFPPTGGQALYEDLASTDKQLVVSPGTHTEVPASALDQAVDWLGNALHVR